MSGQPDLPAVLSGVPPAHAVILMSHSPGILDQLGGRPWLVLAGHTHGLQWSLPGLDTQRVMRWPLVQRLAYATEWWGANLHGASRHTVVSYRYPVGWFRHGETQMYVCRGVGFLQTVPLRIACPGEIALFTLR
jgi:predicted MPP superfamily phosphohydrolase